MTSPSSLIAPCGMNCGICLAYLREKNHCPGCRGPDKDKNISCVRCSIKSCRSRSKKEKFCIKCIDSPCDRLKNLDKRYRMKYHMSMIENLKDIKEQGVRRFLQKEKKRWTCPKCGGMVCVHRGICLSCEETDIFSRRPKARRLYENVRRYIESLGQIKTEAMKTQVSFGSRKKFAWVWLPQMWVKKRPEDSITVAFGLRRRIKDARIAGVAETGSGRWTHHVVIQKKEDFDDDVRRWLKEAYENST